MRYNGEYCHFLGTISAKHNFAIAVKLFKKGPLNLDSLKKELGFGDKILKKHLQELMSFGFFHSKEVNKEQVYFLRKTTFMRLLRLVEQHIEGHAKP